jgi:hypothetical protein
MKTYSESCHCGAVRFQAELDFAEGTFKCNCTSCAKARSCSLLRRPLDFASLRARTVRRNMSGPHRGARSRLSNSTSAKHAEFVPRGEASLRLWAAHFTPSRCRCSTTLIPRSLPLRRSAMSTADTIVSIGRRTTSASSNGGSNPAPNSSAIIDVVLAESIAQPRLLERNDRPIHRRPRENRQGQRPSSPEHKRQSDINDGQG